MAAGKPIVVTLLDEEKQECTARFRKLKDTELAQFSNRTLEFKQVGKEIEHDNRSNSIKLEMFELACIGYKYYYWDVQKNERVWFDETSVIHEDIFKSLSRIDGMDGLYTKKLDLIPARFKIMSAGIAFDDDFKVPDEDEKKSFGNGMTDQSHT